MKLNSTEATQVRDLATVGGYSWILRVLAKHALDQDDGGAVALEQRENLEAAVSEMASLERRIANKKVRRR